MNGRLETPEAAKNFINAGNAYVTLVSTASGARFTYRVSAPKKNPEQPIRFVGLLNGPDNNVNYLYIGVLKDGHFERTKRSLAGDDAPSVKAIKWTMEKLSAGTIPPALEIWHEGRCGRCGRRLTVPESINIGLGPECLKR